MQCVISENKYHLKKIELLCTKLSGKVKILNLFCDKQEQIFIKLKQQD